MTASAAGLVVDASVSLAWFFEDEATEFTEQILDEIARTPAWVPSLWILESANVLATAERRRRISRLQRRRLVEQAMRLPVFVDREPVSVDTIDGLCETHGLSAYDAAYLELAMRRSLTLVTLDGELVAAARAAGHPFSTSAAR